MYAVKQQLSSLGWVPMPTIGMRPGQAATPCVHSVVPSVVPKNKPDRVCASRSHVVPTATQSDVVHGLVLVPVRFQLVASSTQAVQDYRLTGSGSLFGGWNVDQAPRLTKVASLPDGGTLWAVQFDLLPGTYIYKVGKRLLSTHTHTI